MVYIDCVEFYNERLISISISQQINAFVEQLAKQLAEQGKITK